MPVDELAEQVLAYINTARITLGHDPIPDIRKGKTGFQHCPIANSLKDVVDEVGVTCSGIVGASDQIKKIAEAWNVESSRWANDFSTISFQFMSVGFIEFICDFDTGKYPEYEERTVE